jgi:hypothetical protein
LWLEVASDKITQGNWYLWLERKVTIRHNYFRQLVFVVRKRSGYQTRLFKATGGICVEKEKWLSDKIIQGNWWYLC